MRIFLSLVFLFLPASASAQKVSVLVIRKARAPIYKKASFDSRILAYAPKGKKLYGTTTAKPGIQGFGLFHKVRIKKGIYGYVLDTDVLGFTKKLKKKSKLKSSKIKNKKSKNNRLSKKARRRGKKETANKDSSHMQKWKGYPLSFVKAAGGGVSNLNYTIDFGGKEIGATETVFGLKLSGPGWIMKSMPLDVSVLVNFGGIGALDKVSQGSSSGYFLLADVTFPFRLKKGKSWSIYGGLGLLLNYSDFTFRLNNDDKNSSGASLGAVGTLGFVYNMGNYLLKFEPKLYWDDVQYTGFFGSVQYVL